MTASTATTDDPPVLHVVATPIGTLGDLSPRAKEILARVEFVACEDTRHTARLLAASGLHVPLVSLHEHNERNKSMALLGRLRESGKREAALVTDAGTPGVSDPGSYFVGLAHEAGVRVLSAPGPSSLAAALGACGFESGRVVFSTFFPRDTKGRNAEVAVWRMAAPCVGVCFESPHRLVSSLAFLERVLPAGTRVCVSREISKKHEEHVRGPVAEVHAAFASREEVKGECVVSVELGESAALSPWRARAFGLGAHAGEGNDLADSSVRGTGGVGAGDAGGAGNAGGAQGDIETGDTAPLDEEREPTLEDYARECLARRAKSGEPLKAVAKEVAMLGPFAAKELYAAALTLSASRVEAQEETE